MYRVPVYRSTRGRRGIALATALGGIVIIGVLIAGVFFTSNQELRTGTNTLVQERAFRAAEFGLNASLAGWDHTEMVSLPLGGTKKIVYDSSALGWRNSVTITRLTATTYMFVSTGTALGGIQGEARRRNALLVRLSVPKMDFPAALTIRGASKTGGSSFLSGLDADPAGLTCPEDLEDVAGLASGGGALSLVGCPLNSCMLGAPKASLNDAEAADTATYFDYGDEDWSSVTKSATKVYEPGESVSSIGPKYNADGSCNTAAANNWGDPSGTGACKDYFPIIYARGASSDFNLSSGSGQGILFVEGNLKLSGGFIFNGPIVVRGTVTTTGTNAVQGALAAANVSGGTNEVLGTALISYSSCALNRALQNAIPPKRVVDRAWMEVF